MAHICNLSNKITLNQQNIDNIAILLPKALTSRRANRRIYRIYDK